MKDKTTARRGALLLALLFSISFVSCGRRTVSSQSGTSSFSDSAESIQSESLRESASAEKTEEEKENEWQHNGAYAYAYYPQLGRDVMPIGAWCAPPSGYGAYTENFVTLENYIVLAESGINSVYGLYEQAQNVPQIILNALDYSEEVGIVYLVRDTRVLAAGQEPELLDFFEEYMEKPAYGGNLVVDEPGTNRFSELSALCDVWKADARTASKFMYVNMLPSYANTNQLLNGAGGGNINGEISYAEYLDLYLEQVKPQLFSFDFYPFNGYDASRFEAGYFQQLYDVKSRVEKAGIPFWTFAQAGYFNGENTREMPEAEFLWQVNTALAFGAKGIQYFNYWQPYEIQGNNNAFVDMNGDKLYLYDYGVRANKQIAAVDGILMKSANMGVIQTGNSPDAIPEEAKISSFRTLTGATGGDALIGCFDYRGKTAFYVAANNLTENCGLTLTFSSEITAKITIDAETKSECGKDLSLTLTPGNGALIVLE